MTREVCAHIQPSLSGVATGMLAEQVGAVPLYVDVCPKVTEGLTKKYTFKVRKRRRRVVLIRVVHRYKKERGGVEKKRSWLVVVIVVVVETSINSRSSSSRRV